ncbi:Hypothetical predicted protein, partial [Paramuricea clavata]
RTPVLFIDPPSDETLSSLDNTAKQSPSDDDASSSTPQLQVKLLQRYLAMKRLMTVLHIRHRTNETQIIYPAIAFLVVFYSEGGECYEELGEMAQCLESLAQSSKPAEQQYFPATQVHVAVDAPFGRPLLQRGKSLKKTTETGLKSFEDFWASFVLYKGDVKLRFQVFSSVTNAWPSLPEWASVINGNIEWQMMVRIHTRLRSINAYDLAPKMTTVIAILLMSPDKTDYN